MYYVTMTDKFMSGWGPARDKINKLVIECASYSEDAQIARAAHLRREMRREMRRDNIRTTKPHYGAGVLTSWKTYGELSGSWKEA